ncbi:hypothetical protein [Afipia sp. GAS231]|uniref:hypothetical protein n=1 Tax=Afipia sp. GAS231 TaxID=1882747 RepID=UPI00087C3CAF|nr:hypothetical protein [Afipia sp. GAS231]SDN10090.1 hypothetical protein SAMN05444050_0671 [Afipia sp. GAS231]
MRIAGRSFGRADARLMVLPAIAIAGCTAWMMVPWPSDAESQSGAAPSAVFRLAQDASGSNDPVAPTKATLASPAPSAVSPDASPAENTAAAPEIAAPETTAPAKPPIDGLRISSQSWRRGGLGSKALMTFTLRNSNDYAVKDVEIACAFARRDGSHLTDRRRVLPDTVNMKSQKRYSGMLVGFVNVNANKAKCSLVTASRT